MITRLLQEEMDARIAAGEEVADLSEAHTAELAASTHSSWILKFSLLMKMETQLN